MSSVDSSMVFIIHPNLPSVHLLLLTHPAFALSKLPGYSWCTLGSVTHFSILLLLITDLNLLIFTNLVCLIHMSKPLLTAYFLMFFLFFALFLFFLFFFFWKSVPMGTVQCRWGEEGAKEVSPVWVLCCVSSWSQILDCIYREKLLVRAKVFVGQGVWSAGEYRSREK